VNAGLLENIRLGMVTNNSELVGVGNVLVGIEALLTPNPPTPLTVAEVQIENEGFGAANAAEAEVETGFFANLWNRAFGLEAAVAAVDPAIFNVGFDVGTESYNVNWDPRDKPFLSSMATLVKLIICCYAFYLTISYIWNWFEKKTEVLALTNSSGTAGQAILGSNSNLITSSVNATVIMSCVIIWIGGCVAVIAGALESSAISGFLDGDNVIDGTHSAYASM